MNNTTVIEKELTRTRRFYPQVKRILCRQAHNIIKFREATFKEDTQEGFDFMVNINDVKIAIRIRHSSCIYRDFTVRSKLDTGNITELAKIIDGKGDFYLYAWAINDTRIGEYMLIDLNLLRVLDILKDNRIDISNYDGTYFKSYSIIELSSSLLAHEKI